MGKSSCSQDPTQDIKILFNFNIWVGYGLSLDHTGQTKLYKPQQQPLCILYDAIVNGPLPSAHKDGSGTAVAMGILLKKAKKSTAKRGIYATATNLTLWSNTTPRPVWWSVGAVLHQKCKTR
jgi:hypothetical protein